MQPKHERRARACKRADSHSLTGAGGSLADGGTRLRAATKVATYSDFVNGFQRGVGLSPAGWQAHVMSRLQC